MNLSQNPIHLILVPLITFGICAALVGASYLWIRRVLQSRSGASPATRPVSEYKSRSTLLTPAERSFFGVLQQALGTDYLIFAKVRLADIVEPVKNTSRSGWQTAFNRITGKHVDFVLCDRATTRFVGIIELDDKSHGSLESGFRDSLVDDALKSAGIPVLRVPAARSYTAVQIREQFEKLLRLPELAIAHTF